MLIGFKNQLNTQKSTKLDQNRQINRPKIDPNLPKTLKIDQNRAKSKKMSEKLSKSIENVPKSNKIYKNRPKSAENLQKYVKI